MDCTSQSMAFFQKRRAGTVPAPDGNAIDNIKQDCSQGKLLNRLICGDVGTGNARPW